MPKVRFPAKGHRPKGHTSDEPTAIVFDCADPVVTRRAETHLRPRRERLSVNGRAQVWIELSFARPPIKNPSNLHTFHFSPAISETRLREPVIGGRHF